MRKPVRWLLSEVDRWVVEGIVTREQGTRIRARYPEVAQGLSWGLVVFFGLGAVVVGLGVILLFAYNWDAIPKFGKLALVLGALVAAHAGGLILRGKSDWRPKLGEALTLVGTMTFGAGIWLVAQIYNIDEHFPDGFVIWALGALAMAWTIDSMAHGLLAVVLLVIWGGSETFAFNSPVQWAPLLLAGGVGPLAWRLRSPLLLAALLAGLYFLLLCDAAYWGGIAGTFGNGFAFSALLLALGRLTARRSEAKARDGDAVLRAFGWGGFLFCAYVLGFRGAVRDLYTWKDLAVRTPEWAVFLHHWLVMGLAATVWAWLLARVVRGERGRVPIEEWLVPIALIYSQILGPLLDEWLVATVFNLVCLGVATMAMVRGCRQSRLEPTIMGSLLLSLVVAARYFDLFQSLALRGVVFVGFGLILFAEGFFYRRARRSTEEGGTP